MYKCHQVFQFIKTQSISHRFYSDSIRSAYEKGLSFEKETIESLSTFQFALDHTGQTLDKGVDFNGQWNLPNETIYHVIGQCKSEKRKIGARSIREFEGTLSRYRSNYQSLEYPLLGIFSSSSGYTKHALDTCVQSKYPIILIVIEQGILTRFYTSSSPSLQSLTNQLIVSNDTRGTMNEEQKNSVELYFKDSSNQIQSLKKTERL
mmetsp:Transcript_11167/g.16498  ORF Transcript_11167/g.16498 Transcript_11167/m.16498 type:complete len:206 (+) Transcript_11167:19-636(+)